MQLRFGNLFTVGATYTSNNPCFPGQLFHVISITDSERFGKPNQVVEYERWAWPHSQQYPYRIETTKSWLYSTGNVFLGLQLPSELQLEFNQLREAVLTAQEIMR